MDLLIIKKLTGQKITSREQEVLDAWLESDPENRKIYFQLKLAFSQEDQAKLDTCRDEIWRQINTPLRDTGKRPIVFHFVSWAAVLILAFGLSWWLINDDHGGLPEESTEITYIEKRSLPGQKVTTMLPDGTRVKLNSGSKLIVPERFEANRREVRLEGEAYFEVTRDESKPFFIKVDDFEVKVLGTSFSVSAYPEDGSKHVAVRAGRVSVKGKSGNSVELSSSQMTQINETGGSMKVTSYDADLILGWIDQKLVFKNNSFEEVISEIKRWYDVNIIVRDEVVADELFTGSFQNGTITEVISSVTRAYKLNFKTINDTIIVENIR